MASIFKVTVTRNLPNSADLVTRKGRQFLRRKRGGRLVMLPVTDCGAKYQDESRKWYIQYRDANGKKQRVPGYTDKQASTQLAAELERKAEHIQSGLADPHEKGKLQFLRTHLEAFRTALTSESNSEKHVSQTCIRIERLIEGCNFQRWIDIVA